MSDSHATADVYTVTSRHQQVFISSIEGPQTAIIYDTSRCGMHYQCVNNDMDVAFVSITWY